MIQQAFLDHDFICNVHAGSQVPDGLGVRIPDSHSGGPGSIPGQGALFKLLLQGFLKILQQTLGREHWEIYEKVLRALKMYRQSSIIKESLGKNESL